MTEIVQVDEPDAPPLVVKRVTPTEGADMLMVYFMRRRDVLIAELRELDRLLGRPQTIPAKER